jgi:hypothetical protein
MEKIYMEDSSSSQSSQSSQSSSKDYKRQFKISVILSFVVAFFAMYSLIACGISQVSYAAPTDGESVPEETFDFGINNISVDLSNGSVTKTVPIYYGVFNGGYGTYTRSIFCIEPDAETVAGKSYVASVQESDAALLYLLSLFYNDDGTDKLLTGDYTFDFSNTTPGYMPAGFDYDSLSSQEKLAYTNNFRKYFDSFIKQSAIWAYLYKLDGNDAEAAKLLNFNKVTTFDASTAEQFVFDYVNNADNAVYKAKLKINELVTAALNPNNYSSVDVNLVETESLSKNDDGNYQVGYRIEVPSNASNIEGYKINLSGTIGNNNVLGVAADDLGSDAWIVDENGNVIEDGIISCNTGSSCTSNFTVVVSKDHITQTDTYYTVGVELVATVNGLYGRRYVAADGSNLQKVVSVGGSNYTSSNSKSFSIVTTEDTGMTTAQTIYFIGLVVLLCGIGIVYANAKPAESKQ